MLYLWMEFDPEKLGMFPWSPPRVESRLAETRLKLSPYHPEFLPPSDTRMQELLARWGADKFNIADFIALCSHCPLGLSWTRTSMYFQQDEVREKGWPFKWPGFKWTSLGKKETRGKAFKEKKWRSLFFTLYYYDEAFIKKFVMGELV